MEYSRPDPDELLSEIETASAKQKQGKLKIFIGMAAGVGKTFAMLNDARVEKDRGLDVVSGYIEPHGRTETEDLAKEFEHVPTIVVSHQGLTLHELDLCAAKTRNPDLILVDELAHTNAPGSLHAKRWQDVLELLEHGIDVYTTINVQHLESLNDVITAVTGIRVQETVPDSLLAQAEKIELIDIPPEELIDRLKEGKIYPQEKIAQALQGFFTQQNLMALRELVLRKLADRVDRDVVRLYQAKSRPDIWPVRERILVAITANKFASRLMRSAHRIAESLKAELIVVYVSTPKSLYLSKNDQKLLAEALLIAENLGAKIFQRHAVDISGEILGVAREINATLIVIGKPLRNRLVELIFGSVADDLIRRSGQIDVHLITGEAEVGSVLKLKPLKDQLSYLRLIYTAALVSLTTLLCLYLYPYLELANLNMIYLLCVVLVASFYGRREATMASILSVAAFDFFFVPPRFTFAVADAQYLVTFSVMLLIALLLSRVTLQLRDHMREIGQRERKTHLLFEFGKELLMAQKRESMGRLLADHTREILKVDARVYLVNGEDLTLIEDSSKVRFSDATELSVAKLAAERKAPTGNGTEILPGARGIYLPLYVENRVLAVLGLFPSDGPLNSSDESIALVLAQQTALALERRRLEVESREASIEAEREKTRNVLLSAVSHDFRTPLTAIKGCATTLEQALKISEIDRQELIHTIKQEAERLEILVRNVLDLVRLESVDLNFRPDWIFISELISTAIDEVETRLGVREVRLDLPDVCPMLPCEPILIKQLFVNLLENAWKHAANSAIQITSYTEPDFQVIKVRDFGVGLQPGQEERIFEKAFRGQQATERAGFGLGLTICREIVKLHSGKIFASNAVGGGAEFTIKLPLQGMFKEKVI